MSKSEGRKRKFVDFLVTFGTSIIGGIVSAFIFWVFFVLVNPQIHINIGKIENEIYVRLYLPKGFVFQTDIYDLQVFAGLKGTKGRHFNKIFGETFTVPIPLNHDGSYPLFREGSVLKFAFIFDSYEFWEDIFDQLNDKSIYKEEVRYLLDKPNPSAEEKITMFKELLCIYEGITIMVNYQHSFTGFRKSVRKEFFSREIIKKLNKLEIGGKQ